MGVAVLQDRPSSTRSLTVSQVPLRRRQGSTRHRATRRVPTMRVALPGCMGQRHFQDHAQQQPTGPIVSDGSRRLHHKGKHGQAHRTRGLQPGQTHTQPNRGLPLGRACLQERYRPPPSHFGCRGEPDPVTTTTLLHLHSHHTVLEKVHVALLSEPRRGIGSGNNTQVSQS
jgi:hypothetical protein